MFYFKDSRIYEHHTVRFNFTTYDLRRDQDTVNPKSDKCFIICALESDTTQSVHPFGYAQVLGVYHAQVGHPDLEKAIRMDFLWVRWMQHSTNAPSGLDAQRLDRIHFVPGDSSEAFGFLDPDSVIRGFHAMPVFAEERTSDYLGRSLVRDEQGDWRFFYVNR